MNLKSMDSHCKDCSYAKKVQPNPYGNKPRGNSKTSDEQTFIRQGESNIRWNMNQNFGVGRWTLAGY